MKQINRVIRMHLAPQVDQITHIFQKYMAQLDSPSRLLYGFVILLIIVYSSIIPAEYRSFADTLLGKLFGITIVYGVTETIGWIYGLLTALAFLLVLHGAPRRYRVEGFNEGSSVSEKKIVGSRWFVERMLKQHPVAISTDQVKTQAITD